MIDIYYLDDEPALCFIFKESFNTNEINITTFTSAVEAVAACQEKPPKAIFVDMRLQDTTGDKVAEELADDIKKYLVTGDMINASDFAFQEVLTKPFDMEHIKSLLDDLNDE